MISREYECGAYVHRANHDGTTDSICKNCFVTVCTSTWETELGQAERDHVCDPDVIARWKELEERSRPKSP